MNEMTHSTYQTVEYSKRGSKNYGFSYSARLVETEATVMANTFFPGKDMIIGKRNQVVFEVESDDDCRPFDTLAAVKAFMGRMLALRAQGFWMTDSRGQTFNEYMRSGV